MAASAADDDGQSDTNVASVTIGSDTTYYNTIASAFEAASGKTATITLLAEKVLVSASLLVNDANSNITLELNGKLLESEGDGKATADGIIIVSAGALTIQDNNDTGKYHIRSKQGTAINANGGSLTVNSGTIMGSSDAAYSQNGATVTVNGGELRGGRGIYAYNGNVVINGGTIRGLSGAAIYASFGSDVKISGGFIYSFNNDCYLYNATVSISGGWFRYPVPSERCVTGYTPTTQAQDVEDSPLANTTWYTVTPPTPRTISVTGTADSPSQVTLTASIDPSASGGAVTYAVNTTNAAPSDGWQDSPVFTGLTENTTYYFFAKVSANGTYAEAVSAGCAVTTPPKEATNLVVVTQPAKLSYTTGETLDLSGLTVKVTYNDGTEETLTALDELTTSPAAGTCLTVSGYHDMPVTVSYKGQSCQTSPLTVTQGMQAELTILGIPDTIYSNDRFTLTAEGGSGSGALSWVVVSGPAAIDQDGNLTITGAGEITVNAVKAGDADYTETNASVTFPAVNKPSSSHNHTNTYPVTPPSRVDHGAVTVSPKSASKGATVTIAVKPDEGYALDTLTVTDASGNQLPLTDKGDGRYTFPMPASKVTVSASFTAVATDPDPAVNPFTDVSESAYYYDAVLWATENGITTGTAATTFGPDLGCTRAQVVTFLWRAAGSPESGASAGNPFTDLSPSAYYYDAVLWAVEQGVTVGTTATTFSPDLVCTRAQCVTFLHRYEGSPTSSVSSSFTDVLSGAYYEGAVQWAAANGVTVGTTATTFSPDDHCTRGQIVTFLYRALAQ